MSDISTNNYYYVYEWWADGADSPFYVGKGCGKRAWTYNGRSHKFIEVINTLTEKKIKTEVRIIYNNLSNDDALRIESERIAFWVKVFATLANISQVYRNKSKQLRLNTSYVKDVPKITCSAEDAAKVAKPRMPKEGRTIECTECQIPFTTKKINRIFCSRKCTNAHRLRLYEIKMSELRKIQELRKTQIKEKRDRLPIKAKVAIVPIKVKTAIITKQPVLWFWVNYIAEDGHQISKRAQLNQYLRLGVPYNDQMNTRSAHQW